MRRKAKGAAEADCFTGWRHRLCYLSKPGVKSKIKRQARRRERREARQEIRRGR